jgi:hypothetical protein
MGKYFGFAFGMSGDGEIFGLRLMGGPDQCLVVEQTFRPGEGIRYCMLPYPHEGDHDFTGRQPYEGEASDDDT